MSKVSDPAITKSMLDKAVDDIAGIIKDFSGQVDERFATLEFKMNARFEMLEVHMDKLEASMEHLVTTIDGLIKRIDDYEQENVARDRQLARLEVWIQQIAKETGVKLKDVI